MHAIAICVAILTPLQGSTAEYTFKHTRAAHFIHSRWRDLTILWPELQLAKSRETAPLTGPWVVLDEKRNRLIFGSRDDAAEEFAKLMTEFDVKPVEVRMTILISRPDWGLQVSGTLQTANSQAVVFGAEQLGATFEFRPRLGNDGNVTVQIMMTTLPDREKSACIVQIDSFGTITFQIFEGKGGFIKGPAARTGEKLVTPPSGDRWKPFKISISTVQLPRESS